MRTSLLISALSSFVAAMPVDSPALAAVELDTRQTPNPEYITCIQNCIRPCLGINVPQCVPNCQRHCASLYPPTL
ncbi:hypothetical protein QBC34DRAFT_386242 [Podospora aff. communis PSN243]|uniref:Uncharacterized protein n=1 Tax=Podospora aff. communis PSN243 TaxID=3040156 RepID=A0AAV9G5B3_9PEZI|nr:hypothetical protein QBC34DRAFT_386242 [Podospora aff. communis PSN243]